MKENKSSTRQEKKILNDLSDFYKIFADPTRLRILDFLLEGEKCVSEISEKLEISQSATSHQLKTLRDSTLVKKEKEGQIVKYSITDDHIRIILQYGLEHIKEKYNIDKTAYTSEKNSINKENHINPTIDKNDQNEERSNRQ